MASESRMQKWLEIVDRDMDTPRILSLDEVLQLVRRYKQLIAPRFDGKLKVILYGSYAKGSANPWSDIDVAVIVPKVNDEEWLQQSVGLVREGHALTSLIEPVLMEDHEDSILFDDVIMTGIAV